VSFTVTDFSDLVRLLDQHPEWQAELRRLVLTADLLALPSAMDRLEAAVDRLAEAQRLTDKHVQELAEAQRRTDERMDRLEAAVDRLAEAQRRTDERMDRLEAAVDRLAEAQRLTDKHVQELAEAQRRTEERVDRLEAAIERLAEAQRRTDEHVKELSKAQQNLSRAFGELQTAFGATIEEEAEGVLEVVLESKGYRVIGQPFSLALDGEVDVVLEADTPTGEKVWALVEAKARLGRRQVREWGQRTRSPGWQRRLAERGVTGPYLVYAHGIRVDASAVQAAEEQGIGLLTGQGERLAPKGLIHLSAD
jgi:hypothetical protein